jgi:Cu2+-exporting ATPase
MVRLVQRAAGQKPPLAQLADKVASYFVAGVLSLCLLAGCYWYVVEPNQLFVIVLAVLVVSCPCALSLATPVALAVANKRLMQTGLMPTTGVMVSGLAQVDTVLFDKTGTLTEGKLQFQRLESFGSLSDETLLQLAMSLEFAVVHPVAKAIVAYGEELGLELKSSIDKTVIAGSGISATIDGKRYALGERGFINELIAHEGSHGQQTTTNGGTITVCLADVSERKVLAYLHFSDLLREDAYATVKQLQQMGKQVQILSGDAQHTCDFVAAQLDIEVVQGAMKPDDKIRYVEQLIKAGHKVLMVGDGVNDAAALKQAHVSVAMTGAAEFVQAKADGVLLAEKLTVLVQGLMLSQRTCLVIKQNIGWALAYNGLSLPMAAMGLIPPWLAALGMSMSSLIVLINSYRLNWTAVEFNPDVRG